MTNTTTTFILPTHIHGVPTEELKQGAINALARAAFELQSEAINFTTAMQNAEGAVACLWSLANAQTRALAEQKGGAQ